MSTLRNTIQRRNHKERAQPLERQKWGILEKPKDYKLRAADHKLKRRKLKALQQKASERNEDEFYFGMMSSQTQGGVKVAQRGEGGGSKVLSREVVGLMKTQDVGYLRTVLQQARKEREKVERGVVGGEVGVRTEVGRERVLFGEEGEVVAGSAKDSEATKELDDLEGLSSEEDDLASESEEEKELTVAERRKRKKQDAQKRKLQALKDREKDLSVALREVEEQRARMNGSIGGVNKNGVKFKTRQRQR